MTERDDFPEGTKRALALRAGHHCSFPGCPQSTAGPSDESPEKFTNIGVAAHICAAAPGGRRYAATMTPEERSHITNGIWLCPNHAALIDRDEVRYTIDVLREMKRKHEDTRGGKVRGSPAATEQPVDLIGIGPDVICTGSYIGIEHSAWSFQLEHFVVGDAKALVSFIGGFARAPEGDRYVVANELGDGRTLTEAPALTRKEGGFVIRCPINPKYERIEAQSLGTDWAISPKTGDLYAANGDIALVSGVSALPQKIRTNLSLMEGESPFHPKAGSRCVEYFGLFQGSPWLERLIKLEVVRLAAVPYHDPTTHKVYTLLQCVECVRDVQVLAETPANRWLPIRVDLDVKGVGRWSAEIQVMVETQRRSN
jgi:hypothetical protein